MMKRVKNIYMLFCRSCDLTPTQKLYRKHIEARDCNRNLEYLQFQKVSEATDIYHTINVVISRIESMG